MDEGGADSSGSLVERVLRARGIEAAEDIHAFCTPKLTHLHNPSLMVDLDRAASRILDALRAREPIAIYGDYDVDGVAATAILFHILHALSPDAPIITYVPHRLEEGYGLNADAIRELASTGAKVIVSVDCGITALEPAQVAKSLGVDLIITDHHHPSATDASLPDAYAIVHPRRPGASAHYPFGDLCGAGVAYKLAWRLATMHAGSERLNERTRSLLVDLLAFAALGTIADIVPLLGENRVIARFGLVRIRHSPFIGLRALVEASSLTDEKIGEMEVGFRLGPRLNAAGRMGHAKDAVELFTTAGPDRAREIAAHLSEQNEARRAVERRIVDQACDLAERAGMTSSSQRAIVLAHPEWHAGVVGICCSRLVDAYCRPVILMQLRDGHAHGSGRSIAGFDLHHALTSCDEHLSTYGGHTMAAGMRVDEPRLAAFTEAFINHANTHVSDDMLRPSITVDASAAAGELTVETVQQLQALSPFGAGNPEVKLLVRDVCIGAQPKLMGAHGKHLSLQLRSSCGRSFRSVAWNWGVRAERLAAGQKIEAVLIPRLSNWTGRAMVEPELRDVRVLG